MTTNEKPELTTQFDDLTQDLNGAQGIGTGVYMALGIVAVIFLILIGFGIFSRKRAEADLQQATTAAAISTVNAVYPQAGAPSDEIVLPGNTQAFIDAPIFARTSGYVKRWYVDIGARVKKGQLLAEIETPEIDQQLQQARADLETARANLHQAEITAERWQALLKTNSVSKQETDQAISSFNANKATVDSNLSNVRRLEELQGFQKIYAPFEGVITARNIDIGALINAGASTPAQELFHLTAINTLRVFVALPQIYTQAIRPGASAFLILDEFPDKTFPGSIARNSNSIDPASRTLQVEVDVDNRSGALLPGGYVRVHLKLPQSVSAVTVPANTLLFRSEGLRVGVVRNGHVELVPVTIGRDYGSMVEVISGITANDLVIVDPSDSLTSGMAVRVARNAAQAAKQ
jgi:RND family efflux transporter MFP subunit